MNITAFSIYAMYIVPPTVLIPIVFALLNFNHLTKPLKIIFWYLIFSGLFNLVALVLISMHQTTTWTLHLYAIIEFIVHSLFYSMFFSKKKRNIFIVLMVGFTTLCVINYFFIQNKIEFNTYTRPLGAIIIIAYSLLFILKNQNDEESWGDNIYNWINAGILLYFASCLFMFIFSNYLLESPDISRLVWAIHDTVLIFEYTLFAVGFYKCRAQQTISSY
ncbi:hypothetical protein [Mucilaginibacter sp. 5C4]|uniref:hypothetical protein n=1 Tax=Mucilaginibacter sp. 5C4 TaxID=3048589 RepID=UPI002B23A727|nr:hypothetical protein [Mucilaginibacter sp. 5C4]MEB0302895.1 hypothetical protein [Mucilaginibacter sp. 5C4]